MPAGAKGLSPARGGSSGASATGRTMTARGGAP